MKTRRFVNSYVIAGSASLLLSGLVAVYLRRVPFASLQAGLGPAFFPTVVIGLLSLLGAISLGIGLTQVKQNTAERGDVEPLSLRSLIMIPAVILYAVAIQVAGLMIPTVAFILSAMLALGVRLGSALIATASASAVIYVLFGVVFQMRMFV